MYTSEGEVTRVFLIVNRETGKTESTAFTAWDCARHQAIAAQQGIKTRVEVVQL